MRALVTGAAGFIGSHLTERLLADGHEVVAVDAFTDYYARWIKERNIDAARRDANCRLIEADLAVDDLRPLLAGVDVIFHLAAQPGVRASWGQSFERYLHDNLLATQRLLEAARGRDLRKVVYASSSSVYGDAETYPTLETQQPLPISPYGVTKLAGEQLCRLYWRRYRVPAVSLRLFTVYGPRQRPDMAFHLFSRALIDGRPIEVFGDGEQSREFTFISDVIDALVAAGAQAKAGEVYNLGGGEVSLNQAIRILSEVSGREAIVTHGETQAGDVRRTAADISKAAADFGYAPRVGLREGLEQEFRWVAELLAVSPR